MPYTHDPNAKLDYSVDWSSWLGAGETISTSTWTVASGITQATPAPSATDSVATIWLTGGTVGSHYEITNHIVTNQGREDDRTMVVQVSER
jgi:hypothetical protein